MLLYAQGDQTLGQRLADQLAEVQRCFAAELVSDLPCVNALAQHVERYSGKMLRPTLVLTSGLAASGSRSLTPEHCTLAAVMEMVHVATLVHDDVLDEAQMRRRGPTINRLRGNEAAVMLGDYLISHAYRLCSSLDDQDVSQEVARATNTVCEGELLQLANRNNWSLDEGTYFEIIRRKTASLCGACCRLGARLSGAEPAVAQALYDYGEKLGIAFQIVDDLLDLTGSEMVVGKSMGRDLAEGKLTLPLIHCLGNGKRAQLLPALEQGQASAGDGQCLAAQRPRWVGELLLQSGSLDYARQWATTLIGQAKQALAVVPDSGARALLADMADALLQRRC